jgi:hypothetical protein
LTRGRSFTVKEAAWLNKIEPVHVADDDEIGQPAPRERTQTLFFWAAATATRWHFPQWAAGETQTVWSLRQRVRWNISSP